MMCFGFLYHLMAYIVISLINEEMLKRADIPEFKVWQSLLAPDGNIYFKTLDDKSEEGIKIYQYSPQTDEIIIFTILKDSWPKNGDIFMDSSNRLWFGAVGYLTEDGTWHLLQTNVDEYFENRKGQFFFLWDSAEAFMESSNGYIWFWKYRVIDNGMAWYNPQAGEGCAFTNMVNPSPVLIEDAYKNIWLSFNNKLFKYQLNP